MDSIPRSGRSPEGGHGNLLQYSCLENSMDSGVRWVMVHRAAELDVTEVTQHACSLAGANRIPLLKTQEAGMVVAVRKWFVSASTDES